MRIILQNAFVTANEVNICFVTVQAVCVCCLVLYTKTASPIFFRNCDNKNEAFWRPVFLFTELRKVFSCLRQHAAYEEGQRFGIRLLLPCLRTKPCKGINCFRQRLAREKGQRFGIRLLLPCFIQWRRVINPAVCEEVRYV